MLVSGVRDNVRHIPIHDICSDLGPVIYLTLPVYQMMRDNITLPWMWQDDCLGSVTKYTRYH